MNIGKKNHKSPLINNNGESLSGFVHNFLEINDDNNDDDGGITCWD